MIEINLQSKTKALPSTMERYWFENRNVGIPRTLFRRIYVPLDAFDSGIEYETQPTKTQITIEWIKIDDAEFELPEKLNLSSSNYPEMEATIYLGAAHNWCKVNTLTFKAIGATMFEIHGSLEIDFESEGVAKNETFSFICRLVESIDV